MEKQTFKISIDAPPGQVWDILWGKTTYPEWTSVFSDGSQVETDWKEGSKVLFLDGKGQGMVSRIARKIDNEFMSFEHLGQLLNGVEDTESEAVKKWKHVTENYSLKGENGKTDLTVELDMVDDFKDYFLETWPKALDKLKSMAEKNTHQTVA